MRRGSSKTGEARPCAGRQGAAIALVGVVLAVAVPAAAGAALPAVATKLRAATAPASQLERVDAVPLPGGATVYRYQQQVGGVPVLNGQAVVNDAVGEPPSLIADSSHRGVDPQPAPRVRRREAIAVALHSTGASHLRGGVSASTFVQPGGGGRLVWRVLVPSGRPLGDFEVLVNAATGDVVQTRDLLRHWRRGHAKLFNPNPVVEHNGSRGAREGSPRQEHPPADLAEGRVTLHGIKGGQHCLRGQWVHAKVGRRPAARGLQAGAAVEQRSAGEGPLRGPDGLLPRRPRPALYPAAGVPGCRTGSTTASRWSSPTRSERTIRSSRRRLAGSSTARGAWTTPRTPT